MWIGFVGRGWQPRIRFAGTYDQHWLDDIFPFLPNDFDDRYFQSAPQDQQLSELEPGATFGCLNMSESGRFVVRVPEVVVPTRFVFDDREEEATSVSDTLILKPSACSATLLWRVSRLLGRNFGALREVQVGRAKRTRSPDKPHFHGLAELFEARRLRR